MEFLKPWATENYLSVCLCMFSWLVCIFPRRGYYPFCQFTVPQFSCLAVSDSLQPHGLQHARFPCPSPTNLILCCPLLLLPSTFPSIRAFSNESALHIKWPKYWSFSFSISTSNEYQGLISFRIDWFDLAIQGTLKSFLQHHSSKASIHRHSAFFMVQLSHPYLTTEKP